VVIRNSARIMCCSWLPLWYLHIILALFLITTLESPHYSCAVPDYHFGIFQSGNEELWIVFFLYLVYPMLPVSLDCLLLVSCVPNVAFAVINMLHWLFCISGYWLFVQFSLKCMLCFARFILPTCLCKNNTLIKTLFFLYLVYPMLPVSLDCLLLVSCVPNVASVSGLSSSCVLCTQYCQCLWIVHSWLPLRFSFYFAHMPL
jgi:uncharacterized membrane protein